MGRIGYDDRYGQWAGLPNGRAPDYTRCAASVYPDNSMISAQCRFRVKYNPNPDGHLTRCGIHKNKWLPEGVAEEA